MSNRDLNDPRYVKWRKSVFARDGFKCQMPGCPGDARELEAHHIRRWADAPRVRYWRDNGVTLCLTCHARVTGRERDFEQTFKDVVKAQKALREARGDVLLDCILRRHAAKKDPG